MTNLQMDDVLGFGELLRAAATQYKDKMIAKDYDPTNKIAASKADGEALAKDQREAKDAHKIAEAKTKVAEDHKQATYDSLSSWCDAMSGALGKTTDEGQAILDIRANLRGSGPRRPASPAKPPA